VLDAVQVTDYKKFTVETDFIVTPPDVGRSARPSPDKRPAAGMGWSAVGSCAGVPPAPVVESGRGLLAHGIGVMGSAYEVVKAAA
jgi:hypothetical protein